MVVRSDSTTLDMLLMLIWELLKEGLLEKNKISVKWQKEVYPAVEIDTSQPPYVFKCQLYDLTGVPPERQKIMVKGGLLKDDADWSKVGVKEGQRLMMMGTADEIVKAPEKGPVFVEDMPEEEQVVNLGHSAGLFNLGNTCYMNSTVQCLHSVPELKSALTEYNQLGKSNDLDHSSHLLTTATRDLFNDLDKNVKPVAPMQFWMVHRFCGKNIHNLASRTMELSCSRMLKNVGPNYFTPFPSLLNHRVRGWDICEGPDIVKALFGIEFDNRIHCAESGEESTETETVYSLKCHISQEVNHLHEGLKRFCLKFFRCANVGLGAGGLCLKFFSCPLIPLWGIRVEGLKSELEKASPSLGRSAVYVKDSRINGLPRYLTIQFVRFFWKRESNQKAKILRKVDYPLSLDVYDLCSDNLRKKLEGPRKVLRDAEGKKAGLKTSAKTSVSTDGDTKMTEAEESSSGSGEASKSASQEGVLPEKEHQLTGIYDLVAVLTHKGRSADSGHYVAWVKQENGKWVQFDDDNPIPQREEDITKLSGGGDWHMAYICMYKARVVPM
ncbi:hypothetical protein RND71_004528 [Anisodus tanguticus]|uniref:Ubiquitin carboxyl-terminal hydrolase n=1 Tax=Anisodus tanguticus TaxID=243964 RepID=A0AAE1SSD7_9SOLA|nr:hypothetical protein RND71_004528 [Anisodus tanguticus]